MEHVDFLMCIRCLCERSIIDFGNCKTGKYGVRRVCKICIRKHVNGRIEIINEQRRANYIKNNETLKRRQREYDVKHAVRISELRKLRRAKNKDKIKEQKRLSRLRNIEKESQFQHAHYLKNSEKLKAYAKSHRLRNLAKYKIVDAIRHARRKNAPGFCSLEQLNARIQYYGEKCWICREPYTAVDHVKPIAKGGSNWPSNLRPICRSCNSSKRAKWPYP